jgi:dienelactone hydrolase
VGPALRLACALGGLAALVLLAVPVGLRVEAAVTAIAFLAEFLTDGARPWLGARPPPERLDRPLGAGTPADLWRPRTRAPHPGLVLVHGLTPEGKDDPRVRSAAAQLARAGFAVLAPDVPGLRAQRLRPDDAAPVRAALDALAAEPGVAPRGLRVVAVSVGLAPTLLAVTEPAPDPRVGVLVSLGGHAEAGELIRYFTTGAFRFGDQGGRHATDPRLVREFVRLNLDLVQDPGDRAAVAAALEAGLSADGPPPPAALGPEGRAVLALLANREPARVDALLAALPAGTRGLLDRLSPARHLAAFPGRLLLVHGRDDPSVPFTEALRLQAAARPGGTPLALVGVLGHVEGRAPRWSLARDALRLAGVAYALFRS